MEYLWQIAYEIFGAFRQLEPYECDWKELEGELPGKLEAINENDSEEDKLTYHKIERERQMTKEERYEMEMEIINGEIFPQMIDETKNLAQEDLNKMIGIWGFSKLIGDRLLMENKKWKERETTLEELIQDNIAIAVDELKQEKESIKETEKPNINELNVVNLVRNAYREIMKEKKENTILYSKENNPEVILMEAQEEKVKNLYEKEGSEV
jgi:hypothetical protein